MANPRGEEKGLKEKKKGRFFFSSLAAPKTPISSPQTSPRCPPRACKNKKKQKKSFNCKVLSLVKSGFRYFCLHPLSLFLPLFPRSARGCSSRLRAPVRLAAGRGRGRDRGMQGAPPGPAASLPGAPAFGRGFRPLPSGNEGGCLFSPHPSLEAAGKRTGKKGRKNNPTLGFFPPFHQGCTGSTLY